MRYDSKETERYYNAVKDFYESEAIMDPEAVLTREDVDNFVQWCRMINRRSAIMYP